MKATIVIEPPGSGGLYGQADAALTLTLPPGADANEYTIAAMRALVHDAMDDPIVVSVARAIKHDAQRDGRSPAVDLYWWLRRHVTFVADPRKIEHVRHPSLLLQRLTTAPMIGVDCDDLAVLGASLLRAMGLPAVFIMAMQRGRSIYHHVFFGLQTTTRGSGLAPYVWPMNPQEATPPGEWPAGLSKVKVFEV